MVRVIPSSYHGNSRGVKRERPPSPSLGRQSYKPWPTVSCLRSVKLGINSDSNTGLGIEHIAFNSDGSFFALSCADLTLRIWNNKTRVEVARLACHSPIVGLAWLDNDAGVMSLSKDGRLGKWAKLGPQNQWHWGEMINLGPEARVLEDTMCLACTRDRIAVAFQRTGVRVWIWGKGSWIAQRSITRTNITTLKFIDGGNALLGGTREGVVWHCAVPNGTMKVYAFLSSSIISIAISPTGMQALVTQASGSACMVELGFQCQQRIGKSFEEKDMRYAGGAVFAAGGKTAAFGSKDGCVLVWDVQKGMVVEGMEFPDGDIMQTVVSYDGRDGGGVVGGTRQGRLVWWPGPQAPGSGAGLSSSSRKRAKVS
ncbi:WD40-repeat-containing domain protein [Favolaschia claudopus]|uniref:WD40-repeat-containing domain protein n=1 Tax=Favolaschia claudopus TaxID=2862362 RepID=A0AAW0CD53_9AGAR